MFFFLTHLLAGGQEIGKPCKFVIVGAGPGGVYTAWRMSGNNGDNAFVGSDICVLEMLGRVGGRILSLRNQGPKGDLTVEMGAYRFPESPWYAYHGFFYAPLTAALIMKSLKLPTAPYEPKTNCTMRKIVDDEGQNAGYAAFVEEMQRQAEEKGVRFYFNTTVTSLGLEGYDILVRASDHNSNTSLIIKSQNVLLNLPMRPLTRLLFNSDPEVLQFGYPDVLSEVRPQSGIKLYVHYEDAWWRNYLNLSIGMFTVNQTGPHDPPLFGRYHDGHTRIDNSTGMARGFLEAVYQLIDPVYDFYGPFQIREKEPYLKLVYNNPTARMLLDAIHRQLVKYHHDLLYKAGVLEKVKGMPPKLALMSGWGEDSIGFGGGIHYTESGVNTGSLSLRALQPVEGLPLYLANEAFGSLRQPDGTPGPEHGWAECSLVMAENVLTKFFGVQPPEWIDSAIYAKFVDLSVQQY